MAFDKAKIALMMQVETKPSRYEKPRRSKSGPEPEASGTPTVIGWQGIRFQLPPDWNLTGFSMNRENGYLRVDAPGDAALTVQVRWMNSARPEPVGPPNVYSFATPYVRKWLRRPTPVAPKPDLRANLERLLKDTAKQAKKSKVAFDSQVKTEKIEGDNDERTAINFSWTGQGRGQGKIWHCATCNRVVVAQVIGLAKDQSAIAAVASQLFATLHDHALNGYDRWALYDLQVDVPEDFRLEEQKLLFGTSATGVGTGRGAHRSGAVGAGEHDAEEVHPRRLVPQSRSGSHQQHCPATTRTRYMGMKAYGIRAACPL